MSHLIAQLQTRLRRLQQAGEARRFVAGAAGVFGLQVAGVGLAYLMQALLTNLMGERNFGDYIYAYNWARLLAAFGSLGLTLSTMKFIPDYVSDGEWGKLRGTLNAFSIVTLVGSSTLALAALALFNLFPPADIDLTTLNIGLALTPLLALTTLYVVVLRALDTVAWAYGPVNVGQNLLMMLGAGAIALLGGSLVNISAITLLGVVILVVVVVQLVGIAIALPRKARGAQALYDLRVWLTTSLPMLLIRGFTIIMDRVDVLMVGLLLGAVPTGIYAVASRTANLATFPLTAANSIAAPRISPLYNQGRLDELERIVQRATLLSLGGSLVLVIGIVLFSELLLSLFGEAFLAGQRVLVILAFAQLINAAVGPVSFLLSMTGHQALNGRIYAVIVALNIALNYIFVAYTDLGSEGIAIATAVAIIVRNLWLYVAVRRTIGINTLPTRIFTPNPTGD